MAGHRDAVIVVPGVMGSVLEGPDGQVLWGMQPALLARAWLTGELAGLAVRPDEKPGRVRATGLLRVPAYAPCLRGIEPYTHLVERLVQQSGDARAVLEFPYDWRLPVTSHANRFVDAATRHLESWREIVRTQHPDTEPASVRLFVVAHSMGGLLVRAALTRSGVAEVVRRVLTLGTPYFGSVNAVRILATGDEGPPGVPRRAARDLARTCPGVYDLLPRYVCVDGPTPRVLAPADISAIGASRELAEAAANRWETLRLREPGPAAPTSAVVGAGQSTWGSLTLDAGRLSVSERTLDDDPDAAGDATVPRRSANLPGVEGTPLHLEHGALAKADDAIHVVLDKLDDRDSGPRLAVRGLYTRIPDLAAAGAPVTVAVSDTGPVGRSAASGPQGISVRSTQLATDQNHQWSLSRSAPDGALQFVHEGLPPGLHRVTVTGGGGSPVTAIMLVTEDPPR